MKHFYLKLFFLLTFFYLFLPEKTMAQTCAGYDATVISEASQNCDNTLRPHQPINFSINNVPDLDSVIWVWDDGKSVTTTGTNTTKTYNLAKTYTVEVTRYFSNNCSDVAQKNITVESAITTEALNCEKINRPLQSIKFAPANTSGIDSMKWKFGDNSSLSVYNTNPVEKAYDVSGFYNVWLIRHFSACVDSSMLIVGVNQGLIKITDTTEKCTNEKIEFTTDANQVAFIDSIHWKWGDNTDTSLYNLDPIDKSYEKNGIYEVKLYRYFNTACVDSVKKEVPVYGFPEISALRLDPAPGCASKYESLELSYNKPLAPSTTVSVGFGDGSPTKIYTYDDIVSQSIGHNYTSSSCGKSVVVNQIDTICNNCFAILLFAKNSCGSALSPSFASPLAIEVSSAPDIHFDLGISESLIRDDEGNFNTCWDTIMVSDTSMHGIGIGCSPANDTVYWSFKDVTSNTIVFEETIAGTGTASRDTLSIPFNSKGHYMMYLSQKNACGTNTDSALIKIAEEPKVSFVMDRFYDCIPADITFINTSDTTLIESNWMFITNEDTIRAEKFVADTVLNDIKNLYLNEADYRVILAARDKFCRNEADTTFSFDQLCEDLYVPNAFMPDSPDPDLKTFKPVAINLISYKMEVFNLHGKLIWSSSKLENGSPAEGWNGTFKGDPCPQGTYVWKVSAKLDDGYTEDGVPWKGQKLETDKKRTVGTVSLLR